MITTFVSSVVLSLSPSLSLSLSLPLSLSQTGLMIVAVSLLALLLVLAEFSFIRRVSSLSLCIIAVVKVSWFVG